MPNKKKGNPHEKPISIPLDFEDAVKKILSVKPEKDKSNDNMNDTNNNDEK